MNRLRLMAALTLALASNITAQDQFTVRTVAGFNGPDSIFLTISGDGIPVFESYALDNPHRIFIRIVNGRLPDVPVEMTYAEPIKRLDLQYDFAGGRCVQLVCETDRTGGYNVGEIQDGIRLSFPVTEKSRHLILSLTIPSLHG